MNETLRLIEERYSCRDFLDTPLTDEQIDAIATAAVQAPSGMNRQHWQVIVVKNKALIEEMDKEGMHVMSQLADNSMYHRIMSRGGKLFYNTPCMVVIAIKEAYPKGAELIDLGIVAENVVIAATSLGLASVHCGLVGFSFAGDKAGYFKTKLEFEEGYECGMAVLLGHAKTKTSPHIPDKSKITIIT